MFIAPRRTPPNDASPPDPFAPPPWPHGGGSPQPWIGGGAPRRKSVGEIVGIALSVIVCFAGFVVVGLYVFAFIAVSNFGSNK